MGRPESLTRLRPLTRRLAIIGAALGAIIFVTKLGSPDPMSEWPPFVQAATSAAGAFLTVWLLIPLMAYLVYLALAPVRRAFRRPGGPPA